MARHRFRLRSALFGHSFGKATTIYTHVDATYPQGIVDPMDTLDVEQANTHAMQTLLLITAVMLATTVTQAQWQPDVRLTNQPASSFTPFNYKCVAASGHVVHAVWYDDRDGNFEIYYKRSPDDGLHWGADTRLTNNSGTSWFSSVAVSGSEAHIVWMDDRDGNFEIYYKRSTDAGVTWSGDTRLTNDTAASQCPSAAVSGSVVNVTWQDARDGNLEIYYKRSPDGGMSWGLDTRLTNNAAGSIFSSVSASGSIVNVLWEEYRDGNAEIYDKRSADGGVHWSGDTRLTNDPAASFSPSAWVSGSEAHVVWYDGRDGNAEIYYKRSPDGGLSWGPDRRLTSNGAGSYHPSVSASGSNVHLVWYDERDGNREIYYKPSTDAGVTWGTDTRLTNNSSESSHPSVAVSGQVVHVLWQDTRDGNWEIYYKRDPTGSPAGADLNGDGVVNSIDLGILLSSWSIPPAAPACGGAAGPCLADLNHDGLVNSVDLGILLASWTL